MEFNEREHLIINAIHNLTTLYTKVYTSPLTLLGLGIINAVIKNDFSSDEEDNVVTEEFLERIANIKDGEELKLIVGSFIETDSTLLTVEENISNFLDFINSGEWKFATYENKVYCEALSTLRDEIDELIDNEATDEIDYITTCIYIRLYKKIEKDLNNENKKNLLVPPCAVKKIANDGCEWIIQEIKENSKKDEEVSKDISEIEKIILDMSLHNFIQDVDDATDESSKEVE